MLFPHDSQTDRQPTRESPKETSPLLPTYSSTDGQQLPIAPSSFGVHPQHSGEEEAALQTPNDSDTDIDDLSYREKRKKVIWISPALGVGIFLSAIDQTVVASAYGEIGSDLNALNSTSWIATAYFLTVTTFQPLYGKLCDIFGRQPMLLFSFAVFGLGCLLCGLARSIAELIAARALAGIGGGGLTTVVAILLSDVATMRERGTWQGYVNIIFGTGSVFGSCMGGILVDSIGWRWIFLLQVPLTAIAFAAILILFRTRHQENLNLLAKLNRVDFFGAFVLICAIFSLLFGLDRGSNESWESTITLGSLCSSLILFGSFVAVEMTLVSEPIAPSSIILKAPLFACYLSNFFSHAAFLSTLYNIPFYFQAADGLSATQAGLQLLPAVVLSVFGSLNSGFVMQRTARYFVLNFIGYISMVVGLLLVFLFTGKSFESRWFISLGLGFIGYAEGSTIVSTLIVQISNVAQSEQAIATACSYLFRTLGSVIGISLGAAIMQHFLRIYLRQTLAEHADVEFILQHVRESLEYIATLDPAVRKVVRMCYGTAMRVTFGVNLGLAAVSALTSWFISDRDLSKN